jgi:hypothetical protein
MCGDGCFMNVVRVDGNLVVSLYQVDFVKGGAAGTAVRVVVDVWY